MAVGVNIEVGASLGGSISQIANLGGELLKLETKINRINKIAPEAAAAMRVGFDALVAKINQASGALLQMERATGGVSRGMLRELRTLESQTAAFGKQLKGLPKVMDEATGGGSRGGGGGALSFMGGGRFMLNWMLFHKALQAAKYGAVDIGMGKVQQDLAKHSLDLFSVTQNPRQVEEFQRMGLQKSIQHPAIKATDVVETASEVLSGWDIKKLGMEAAKEITDTSLTVAMTSGGAKDPKMMARQFQQMVHASAAWQPGGMAALESDPQKMIEFQKRIGGMIFKTTQLTQQWMPDLMQFYQHAGAPLKGMGWSDEKILAMSGMLKDVGLGSGLSGRGVRQVFTGQTGKIAEIFMTAAGFNKEQMARTPGGTKQWNQAKGQLTSMVAAQLSDDEKVIPFLMKLGETLKQVKDVDPAIIEKIGFSKNAIPLLNLFSAPDFMKRLADLEKKIAAPGSMAEAEKKFGEQANQIGLFYDKVMNLGHTLGVALSNAPVLERAFKNINQSVIDPAAKILDKHGQAQQYYREAVAAGMNTPEQIQDWIIRNRGGQLAEKQSAEEIIGIAEKASRMGPSGQIHSVFSALKPGANFGDVVDSSKVEATLGQSLGESIARHQFAKEADFLPISDPHYRYKMLQTKAPVDPSDLTLSEGSYFGDLKPRRAMKDGFPLQTFDEQPEAERKRRIDAAIPTPKPDWIDGIVGTLVAAIHSIRGPKDYSVGRFRPPSDPLRIGGGYDKYPIN